MPLVNIVLFSNIWSAPCYVDGNKLGSNLDNAPFDSTSRTLRENYPNAEFFLVRIFVSLRIQSECGKILTRKKLRIWTHFTQWKMHYAFRKTTITGLGNDLIRLVLLTGVSLILPISTKLRLVFIANSSFALLYLKSFCKCKHSKSTLFGPISKLTSLLFKKRFEVSKIRMIVFQGRSLDWIFGSDTIWLNF